NGGAMQAAAAGPAIKAMQSASPSPRPNSLARIVCLNYLFFIVKLLMRQYPKIWWVATGWSS
ncbi:MAG: hypothetical protein WA303_24890, partial [Bradyrhizobium sp.]